MENLKQRRIRMATKKKPGIKPEKFNSSVDELIKRLQDAKALAAKAFGKPKVALAGVRASLNATANKLETLIKNAHGDDETGPKI